jgi:hypothetical protein
MRRVVSAIWIGVLAGALWPGVAAAAPRSDLASAFAMRTFGVLPIARALFTATSDRSLRGLAFETVMPVTLPALTLRVADLTIPEMPIAFDRIFDLHASSDRFVPSAPSPIEHSAAGPASRFALTAPALRLAAYAPFAANASIDDASPVFAQSLRDASTAYSASTQLGALHLSGTSGSADLAEVSARDESLKTLSSVDVGSGRHVNFNLASSYERLSTQTVPTVPTFQYRPTATALTSPVLGAGVPGLSAADLAGGYSDVTARGIDAGVAVPLTRNLTLGMQYGTQRYTGAVNAQDFEPNFDTSKYSYVGNVTFAIPRTSSSIVVSARQNRFQDNLTLNTTYETRADVNFTVKF